MRTVLAHGTFDIPHLGHIRHLREARQMGDRLVVSVTADRHVGKGRGRPQFSAEQRREALLALDCVDEVVISDEPTAVGVIRKVRPQVYVKGVDYAGGGDAALAAEVAAVEEVGGEFRTTTSQKWSSTHLLRDVRLSDAASAYAERARARGFLGEILAAFERADALSILFAGETIVDEYRYVSPLAKPSKEFILATLDAGSETFEGGVVAAAKHGEWRGAHVVTSAHAIRKTRFVGADFNRKLFEVYSATEVNLGDDRDAVAREIGRAAKGHDAVVAFDFGHGFFDCGARETLRGAKFLAATAQSNAGNYGFNSALRWRSHMICVDEPEARLATGHRVEAMGLVANALAGHVGSKTAMVTRGRLGAGVFLSGDASWAEVPAFVSGGLDTMGAGDAFLAVAAPLVAAGLGAEMAAFAGCVAGGLKTTIVGHREHVGRQDIVKNLEWLLR